MILGIHKYIHRIKDNYENGGKKMENMKRVVTKKHRKKNEHKRKKHSRPIWLVPIGQARLAHWAFSCLAHGADLGFEFFEKVQLNLAHYFLFPI